MKLLRFGWHLLLILLAPLAAAETLQSGPFIVDFDEEDRATAEESLSDLLAARDEFAEHLPLGDTPVEIRIAHNLNEFLGLSGIYAHVGVSGVTRSDLSKIAVKSPRLRNVEDDFRGTVRHELVHILLHRNTDTDRLPRWLNEGICMMLANEIRWESAIEVTRMHLTGQIIPIASLDRAFLAQGGDVQFSNAYSQALAMTRALYDELGEEAFWELIPAMKTMSFQEALVVHGGLTEDQFWSDFTGGLWSLSLLTTLRTGSFWGVIAVLCLVTGGARWWRNRRIMRGWTAELEEESSESFDWDRILEDSEAWKRQQREDT